MFIETRRGSVVYLTSTLLPCPHGFSTRAGGVSALPHLASMNFAVSRGDDPANVAENFRRFTRAAGLPEKIACGAQVHGTKVLTVRPEDAASLLPLPPARTLPEADGFVTAESDVTLCVKIADCVPLLLFDADAGIAAALHAGWQGSAAGIALRGVETMVRLGARADRIRCAIGPSIHPCCFAVREDFVQSFRRLLGASTADRFLIFDDPGQRPGEGRCHADLQGLNRHLLLEAGLLPENIDISPECTCCAKEGRFFSHRASGGRRGVMAAMISPGRGGEMAESAEIP